ncbi:MAG: glycoside hydrolase family 3 N-terminal domain-containing protein [Ktedonobacteraceae bacterium]
MTINKEQTPKSSKPNFQSQFEKQEEDTPRRLPIINPSHIPSSSQPAWTPHVTALSQQATLPLPPLISPAQIQQPKRRRLAIPVSIALALLAILITLGGFFGRDLLTSTTSTPGQLSPAQPMYTGAFVQQPLNAMQIDSLRHLIGYMKYKQLASMYVARMPLDVELGQLIMVEYSDTYYSPDVDMMVNKLHAGGVIMYEFQMKTFNQTRNDIAQMQKRATFPLLISTDEEGGPYVHRLQNIYGPRMSATDIYNTGNLNVATQQGHKVAHDLLSLGINESLAPDVDVNLVNGYDMVTRTFGNDPASVIKFAGAYMQAMQSDGVVACIKHYPGLGDALTDAHTSLPVVNRTRQQIYSVELAPFKAFIQAQNKLDYPGMIMPTDVLMPAIDPVYPAELSHIFMTDILRKEFGYDGVVLTDALYMKGITDKWDMPTAAVMALNAGNDMLLGPTGADQMIATLNALKTALQHGTLSKARIDEAATRIIALKMEYHLMPAIPPEP